MKSYNTWVMGTCETCRKRRECYRGRCFICRHPVRQRPLLEVGIPCSTAGGMVNLLRKCSSRSEAQKLLETVHPVVMQNLSVGSGMLFRVLDKTYEWRRREGWHKRA